MSSDPTSGLEEAARPDGQDDGQTLVEYVLILTLCSILLVATLVILSGSLAKYIGKVAGAF